MASPRSRRTFLKSAAALSFAATTLRAADIFVPTPGADSPLNPPHPKIRQARAAGLAALQPSPKQLEHGLALHAESLVCEPYGFSPRCAVDGGAFEAAVVAGASDRELQDLREEMMMTRCVTDARERAEYLEAFRASGLTCVFQNAGEEGNDPVRLQKRLGRYTFVADLLRPDLSKAAHPDDIAAAKKAGKLCLYLAANGVPLPQQWENARDELGLIRVFFQAGIRSMHLTYNRRNPMGDGAGEQGNGGLSDFGHAVVKEMNRVGVIVDVAHSGWRTAAEAAKASGKPVMASHTTCAGLFHHIRAKPDEVLKAVCDTGGLFGICAIGRFLGGAGDIRVMLDRSMSRSPPTWRTFPATRRRSAKKSRAAAAYRPWPYRLRGGNNCGRRASSRLLPRRKPSSRRRGPTGPSSRWASCSGDIPTPRSARSSVKTRCAWRAPIFPSCRDRWGLPVRPNGTTPPRARKVRTRCRTRTAEGSFGFPSSTRRCS
jgi:membrane dipeptidase